MGTSRFVYFENEAAGGIYWKKSRDLASGTQACVGVCVCFIMVLVHCMPLQCICRGPDPDQENQEVRLNIAG